MRVPIRQNGNRLYLKYPSTLCGGDLLKRLSGNRGLTTGDWLRMLSLLTEELKRQLDSGRAVEVPYIGYFRPYPKVYRGKKVLSTTVTVAKELRRFEL